GFGFDSQTCAVMSTIDRQSPDIAMGVDVGGAGDQGMMFGYATDETEELMPMPIMLAHRITKALADRRKSGDIPWLRPDGTSKVDRSACYAARWVAKNIVAAGLARRCEVQLAYAIGVAEPVSVMVDTFETSTVPEAAIMKAVRQVFDLTPRGIIEALDLRKP